MTVPAQTRRSPVYSGNGVTLVFPFSFKVFAATDIQVLVTSVAGTLSTATYLTDYSVTLNADQTVSPGGSISYSPAPAFTPLPTGAKLVIIGALPYDQPLGLPNGGNFNPVAIENEFDRTQMQIQQLASGLAGAITVPVGETVPALPAAAIRAGYVLAFDSLGNPIATTPVSGAVGTLATDLANAVTASKGAGQVGFTAAVAYGVGTVGAALNTIITTFVSLTTLAASTGAGLVGWFQSGAGAVTRNVRDKLRERQSVEDFGAVGDGVTDDTAAIQRAIDTGKPFYLKPQATYRCAGKLVWKVGAYMYGSMSGAIPGSGGDTGATVIKFDDALTSVGIELGVTTGFLYSWGIEGVTLTTTTALTGRANFRMFNVLSSGSGVYNFVFRNLTIVNAQYGFYIDNSFFASTWDNVAIIGCYKGVYKTVAGFMTSMDVRWLKLSFCFHGIDLSTATYNCFNVYYDNCGITIPWIADAPATEMPVLQKFNNVSNFTGSVGSENSNAMFTWAANYSNIEQAVFVFNSVATLWQESASRVSNIVQAQQALIRVDTSFVKIKNWNFIATTGAGYPAASATVPSYFARIVTAGDAPRLIIENSVLNLPSYCVSPAADAKYLFAPDATNTQTTFGATNICTLRNAFGIENGRLRVGETTVQDYSQITRNATLVSGDEALRVTGATGASASIRVFACAGGSANAANAPFKTSSDAVTSRGINSHGTINASGTDYAEYIRKAIGCAAIQKGALVGITAHGEVTDKWADAVAFMVKSTNPSYVGGDTWGEGLEGDELEAARQMVDRIAFAGQVPVCVSFAQPGDYIVPAQDGAGITGIAVAVPTFDQYRAAVGRVIAIEADGRARILVKVA